MTYIISSIPLLKPSLNIVSLDFYILVSSGKASLLVNFCQLLDKSIRILGLFWLVSVYFQFQCCLGADNSRTAFFFLRFYLFIHERHRERKRGRDTGKGKSRLPAGSLMWDPIPGPRDHNLSWRQMLNHWATQGSPLCVFLINK